MRRYVVSQLAFCWFLRLMTPFQYIFSTVISATKQKDFDNVVAKVGSIIFFVLTLLIAAVGLTIHKLVLNISPLLSSLATLQHAYSSSLLMICADTTTQEASRNDCVISSSKQGKHSISVCFMCCMISHVRRCGVCSQCATDCAVVA
jgi:hypothetical protein